MKLSIAQTLTIALSGLVLSVQAMATDFTVPYKTRNIEHISVSDHHTFSGGDLVDGATILVRDGTRKVVTASITTRALEADTAYSIWWAVFNKPQYCMTPNACVVADLGPNGDPRVNPSVFYAGGFISDIYGLGTTNLRLTPGRTKRELFAGSDAGLQNFMGAEIHLVLRTHGPAGVAGSVAQQIGTASEACPPDNCKNVFASIHKGAL